MIAAIAATMKNTPANTAVRLVEFMDPRSDVALSSRRSHAVQDSEALRRAGRMVADLLGPYGIPPRSGPHFAMTLVDLSPRMLLVSRRLNPECEHIKGDIRTLRLGRTFDVVFVHDAICHMT